MSYFNTKLDFMLLYLNMKITKNITIFYHEHCLDGFTGAYIAWKKFKEKAEYIPLSHNDSGEDFLKDKKIKISELKDKEVYFIDFCLNEKELKKVEKVAKKLVVIDHHIGRKELIETLPNHLFRDGVSGGYLAHEYFFPKNKMPELVKYVSVGDTWTFSKNEKTKSIEESILSYINTQDFDFKVFQKLEKDLDDKNKFLEAKNVGDILQKVKTRRIKNQSEYVKIINWEGYKVGILNSTSLSSEIGNKLCVDNKIDFAMIYRFSENELKFSLRGVGKVDLVKIAKQYGGGGHFNASGFRTKDLNFINEFVKKIIS